MQILGYGLSSLNDVKNRKSKKGGIFVLSDSMKNCLSCSNSFSEPSDNTDGDILHCMEQNGKIVEENGCCSRWN